MKKTIFCIIFVFIVFFFGRNLNPFSNSMFTFHDETQPARIEQFVLDLKNLQIPPRFAPDFSFKLGYPVFNFYAPTSYWITSIFYFDFFFFFTGEDLYISSLYYPLDIFVRGNLGEVWFLALFPLGLFFLVKNAKKPSRFIFFATVIGLFLLFTAHNLLSTMAIMICLFFILLLPHKKINSCAFIFSLLLAGYFFLPLLLENHLTYAKEIATATKYWQHFVCPQQLWQSPWGFGGSTAGCTDGMSFKIGKMQLVLGGLGMLLFFLNLKKH
ncbi:hypothetical protein HY041_00430, partial [Candidatus Roizmanbacteria bacterium]|nr:hypothetical protein [Candidatus Roizmanbacteria bacterium]